MSTWMHRTLRTRAWTSQPPSMNTNPGAFCWVVSASFSSSETAPEPPSSSTVLSLPKIAELGCRKLRAACRFHQGPAPPLNGPAPTWGSPESSVPACSATYQLFPPSIHISTPPDPQEANLFSCRNLCPGSMLLRSRNWPYGSETLAGVKCHPGHLQHALCPFITNTDYLWAKYIPCSSLVAHCLPFLSVRESQEK